MKKTKNTMFVFYCNVGNIKPARIDKYITKGPMRVVKKLTDKHKNSDGVVVPITTGESRMEILTF